MPALMGAIGDAAFKELERLIVEKVKAFWTERPQKQVNEMFDSIRCMKGLTGCIGG